MKIPATIALLFALIIARWLPLVSIAILFIVGLLYIDKTG